MVINVRKIFTPLIILATVFLFVPIFSQALTYNEIVQSQTGKVLGESTAAYPYPSGSLVNDNGTIYFINGTTKIPFTNWQAFVGLRYSLRNVTSGDLTNYTPSTNYFITTANAEHPWGSWLLDNGTVYYSHETGLIGVPSWNTFIQNGGNVKFIARANRYDLTRPRQPTLQSNDARIYRQPITFTESPSTPSNTSTTTSPVACAMDIKLCPDGKTYVSRQGSLCEFAACPVVTPPATTTPINTPAQKLSTNGIRSVTFNIPGVDLGATDQFYNKLSDALPSIKSTGFNTIWLVNWWQVFEPTALPQPAYNQDAFARLKKVLDLLRANNMKAILGVNYIGGYRPPQGVDGLHWIQNPDQYKAFETYLAKYLTEIKNYNDMVYIMVFTENSEPDGMADQAHAQQVAGLLRPTLGSMPTRLPQDLRNLFTIGYHDYSIINLGWGNGQSPIADPNSYDFVSMVAYGQDLLSYTDVNTEIATRAQRFKNLYPNTPLMIGELGGNYCDNNEQNQARVVGTIVSYALKNSMGSNVWGWTNKAVCGATDYDQFGITNPDGSMRQATQILKQVYSGQSSVENWLKLPAPDNSTPVGQFDKVDTSGNAIGWTYDPDEPSLPIHAVFYLDGDGINGGKQIGEMNANSPRSDVNSSLNISGNHGFVWPIPQQYKDGKQHTLYVYGRDSSYDGRRNRLINGTKTFAFNPDGSIVLTAVKDPSGFGATVDSQTCGRVSLYWFRNGADSFNIYRGTTNNAFNAQKIISGQAYTDQTYGGYVDLNVPAGTYYYWVENVNGPTRIALFNNDKGGLFNPGCNATPAQDPTGFGGKIVTEVCGRVDVWWFRNGAGAYNIYRNTSNDVNSAQKIVANLSYTDPAYGGYSDINLLGATYYYWVENVGSTGEKVSLYNNNQGGLMVGACN